MMKKVGIVFLVLLLCLLSVMGTGCGQKFTPDTSPEYKFETDCQYNQYHMTMSAFMTESEDGYYYIDNNCIHVIDKKTMLDTVLCGKPNCLHGEESDSGLVSQQIECNAYVDGLTSAICYYDGAIYTMTRRYGETFGEYTPVFTRFAVDGSGRKDLFDVDFGAKEELVMGTYTFFIHRGIVYFATGFAKQDVNAYMPEIVDYRLYSYNLTTKKKEKLYSVEAEGNGNLWGNYVYALGDNIYFAGSKSNEDADSHIWRFNISTKEVTFFEYANRVLPVGDKLLYYYVDFEMDGEERAFKHWIEVSDVDGNNKTSYAALNLNDFPMWKKQIQTDGKNLFVADNNAAPETTEIRVYDFQSGEHTVTLPLPEKIAPMGDRTFHCSQDGKLWMYSIVGMDEMDFLPRTFFYCNISDIGTPDFQWYEVEKVN